MKKIFALTAVFLLFSAIAWADGAQDFVAGLKLRGAGQYREALSYYTRALEDERFILKEYALFEIAETYRDRKENSYAAYTYNQLLKTYHDSALRPRAEARLKPTALIRKKAKPPASRPADEAIWQTGMLFYRQADFESARTVFSQAYKLPAGEETAKCLFWWGKLEERLGRPTEAAGIYYYLAEKFDHTYASYRARERLKALGYTQPQIKRAPDRQEALNADLNRRLLMYQALMDLELIDYAQGEARVITKLTQGLTEESLQVRKLAYPKGYFEKVQKYSRDFSLDPFLTLAVIREESRFRSRALSRSRAHGLMQIIPSTGKILAKRLSIKPYRRSKMYEVDTNLKMGTFYLSDLIRRFDGNVALALAGYNGGPVRIKKLVNNWYNGDMRNLDIDEFIEFIPMRETRYYVQKVLGSYYEYKRLYE
ncbi:MAG: transglycosylase SLT domain-containing protein [Candidatus Margulisiibacteriota bacterium]